ncbi:MAG TPA: IS5/IS1182 family transposase, partial [Xanthobacteraceae bacterium]|nr:IS5/IS1182 family transposase [Xanthobacteraceae bacterium]
MMAGDELFAGLPTQAAPRSDTVGCGAPRLREPNRAQIELRAVDIDSLIGQDHLVRV